MALVGSSRFELLSKLGEGGMGIVYEAHDRERNMRVALKTLRRLDASSLYQFKREFRALSDLSHPNIVALYELISEGDEWFLSMELVVGTDFISHVQTSGSTAARAMGSPSQPDDDTASTRDTRVVVAGSLHTIPEATLPPDPAARLDVSAVVDLERLRSALAQLAQALHALHIQGMVHRDLKPSNVRVTPEGRVVLMDFGIVAQASEASGDEVRTRAVGTPAYMAPEQAAGKAITAAADWYGFGVLLYMALARRLPYDGSNEQVMRAKQERDPAPPSAYVRGIPEDLESLCMRLLARDPGQRPVGGEVLASLGIATTQLADLVTNPDLHVFVGRDQHLAALRKAYEDVTNGHTTCVVVEGSSGMGKSTLLRRFASELRTTRPLDGDGAERPMLLSGRCHERESLPYKAFDGVIDSLSHELLALPDRLVDALLPTDIDLLTRLFPVLRRIPGVQAARPLIGTSLADLRTGAVASLRTLLDNIGARQPVVMRIDDLQWADSSSLDLLVDLLAPPAPGRLMVLGSIRTDAPDFEELPATSRLLQVLDILAQRGQCIRLPIGPLSPVEQTQLVQTLIGGQALPGPTQDLPWADLQAESGGNPLFLTEMARFVAEFPETVLHGQHVRLEDVIVQRFERLPAAARALLEAAVVAGEPMPVQLLAAAAGLSSSERERAASMLQVTNWIRTTPAEQEPWLNVQHEKLRTTILAHLPDMRRRKLHLCLAQALEHWEGAPVPLLARHWMAVASRAQAAQYLVSAARFATDRQAFERAASLYRVALELLQGDASPGDRLPLLRALGDVLTHAGRSFDAASVYASAAAHAVHESRRDTALELMRLSAEQLLRSGHIDQGMAILSELLIQLGAPIPSVRSAPKAALLVERVRIALSGLRHITRSATSKDGARDHHEAAHADDAQGPARADSIQHLEALHTASMTLSMIDNAQGALLQMHHLSMALRHGKAHHVCRAMALEVGYLGAFGGKPARRARKISREVTLSARKLGDPALLGLTHLCAGTVAFFSGRMRTAVDLFADSVAALDGVLGVEWERTTARHFRCMSLLHLGAWVDMADESQECLEIAGCRNDIYAQGLFQSIPNTWRLLIADRVDEAHESLDAALRGWPSSSFLGSFLAPQYRVALSRAVIHLYEGNAPAAAQVLDQTIHGVRRLGIMDVPLLASELLAYRGRAALLMGELSLASRIARRMVRLPTRWAPALAALLLAPVRLRNGQTYEAERLVSAALEGFSEQGAAHFAAACQHRLGQLLGGSVGVGLQTSAQRWIAAQGIANPERMLALLTWSDGQAADARADHSQSPPPRQPEARLRAHSSHEAHRETLEPPDARPRPEPPAPPREPEH